LLLGALLLFAALASIMLLTRKLNWYTVSARAPLPADLAGPQ
jgi:inner membrane protein involved in colicin E2 resistance